MNLENLPVAITPKPPLKHGKGPIALDYGDVCTVCSRQKSESISRKQCWIAYTVCS